MKTKILAGLFILVSAMILMGQSAVIRNAYDTNNTAAVDAHVQSIGAAGQTAAQVQAFASTNLSSVHITLWPGGVAQIWNGTNSWRTNFPASTTFGLMEIFAMFPWNTNGNYSGGEINQPAQEYGFSGQIKIPNNWKIVGAGRDSTVWNYTGAGFTMAQVTNAVAQSMFGASYNTSPVETVSLVSAVSNGPPVGEYGFSIPNVSLEGITIKVSNNVCAVAFSSAANYLTLHDVGIGGPAYLQASNGGYHIGYLNKYDVKEPPGLIGAFIGGGFIADIENCDFGGLADSMIIRHGAGVFLEKNTFHVAGTYATGNTNLYSTNSFLSRGFHIYNSSQTYYSAAIFNFFDEARYSVDPTGGQFSGYFLNMYQACPQPTYSYVTTQSPMWDANNNLVLGPTNSYLFDLEGIRGVVLSSIFTPNNIYIQNQLFSDYDYGATAKLTSDGAGNVTAVSFAGSHIGNASGATNLANGVPAGNATNLLGNIGGSGVTVGIPLSSLPSGGGSPSSLPASTNDVWNLTNTNNHFKGDLTGSSGTLATITTTNLTVLGGISGDGGGMTNVHAITSSNLVAASVGTNIFNSGGMGYLAGKQPKHTTRHTLATSVALDSGDYVYANNNNTENVMIVDVTIPPSASMTYVLGGITHTFSNDAGTAVVDLPLSITFTMLPGVDMVTFSDGNTGGVVLTVVEELY